MSLSIPAKMLRPIDLLGTVAAGKLADLVLPGDQKA
jgi:hypothetical protein